jgi:hypothetical protein
MRLLFQASIPKSPQPDIENEDALEWSGDVDLEVVAVCDGATESFAPRQWARDVAKKFLTDQNINRDWISSAAATHISSFDVSSFTWSQQVAAFERGSFSTLLGLRFANDPMGVDITAIGDSFVMLCSDDSIVRTFPYQHALEFDQRPELISTISAWNEKLFTPELSPDRRVFWDLSKDPNPIILVMSDALGQYMLQQNEKGDLNVRGFTALRSPEMYASMVDDARKCGLLRNDDTTLVVIGKGD